MINNTKSYDELLHTLSSPMNDIIYHCIYGGRLARSSREGVLRKHYPDEDLYIIVIIAILTAHIIRPLNKQFAKSGCKFVL